MNVFKLSLDAVIDCLLTPSQIPSSSQDGIPRRRSKLVTSGKVRGGHCIPPLSGAMVYPNNSNSVADLVANPPLSSPRFRPRLLSRVTVNTPPRLPQSQNHLFSLCRSRRKRARQTNRSGLMGEVLRGESNHLFDVVSSPGSPLTKKFPLIWTEHLDYCLTD